MSTEEAPDARLPNFQTTVGLRDWHSLKMKSVPLNAPSEGRRGSEWGGGGGAGSTSPALAFRGRTRGKRATLLFPPPGQSTRGLLEFTLLRTNRSRSRGECPKLRCQRQLCYSQQCQPQSMVVPTDLNLALGSGRSGFTRGLSTWC